MLYHSTFPPNAVCRLRSEVCGSSTLVLGYFYTQRNNESLYLILSSGYICSPIYLKHMDQLSMQSSSADSKWFFLLRSQIKLCSGFHLQFLLCIMLLAKFSFFCANTFTPEQALLRCKISIFPCCLALSRLYLNPVFYAQLCSILFIPLADLYYHSSKTLVSDRKWYKHLSKHSETVQKKWQFLK